jgi:cell volume regulation protein A
MIVFDSSSRFNIRRFDALSLSALRLSLVFLALNLVLLTAATWYIFAPANIILALLFAAAMSGTSPSIVLFLFKGVKTKIFQFLEIESILNTPLIVLIPFLLIDFLKGRLGIGELTSQIIPFAREIIVGIGAGILIGMVLFKIMHKKYHPTLSPIAVIAGAIITYLLSEVLGGNGVLAVTAMGLFFGNVYIKHRLKLQYFSEVFSTILELLVFVLIGLIIKIPLTFTFFKTSLALFGIFVAIRFIAVMLSFKKGEYQFKEKIFISLNVGKGIAVAVIAFTLATLAIEGIGPILDLILAFLIYSIILSSVVVKFSKFFTKVEPLKQEKGVEK